MLYRFRAAMLAEEGLGVPAHGTARPTSIMAVQSLKEAEHWRQQVFRDISQKIMRIQNSKNRTIYGIFHNFTLLSL